MPAVIQMAMFTASESDTGRISRWYEPRPGISDGATGRGIAYANLIDRTLTSSAELFSCGGPTVIRAILLNEGAGLTDQTGDAPDAKLRDLSRPESYPHFIWLR
jgi:hypothetical protein